MNHIQTSDALLYLAKDHTHAALAFLPLHKNAYPHITTSSFPRFNLNTTSSREADAVCAQPNSVSMHHLVSL